MHIHLFVFESRFKLLDNFKLNFFHEIKKKQNGAKQNFEFEILSLNTSFDFNASVNIQLKILAFLSVKLI